MCRPVWMLFAAVALACDSLLAANSDKEAAAKVTSIPLTQVNDCAIGLIRKGYLETAAKLVTRAKEGKIRLKDEVKWAAEELKKQLERVETIIEDKKEQIAVPAAQWAQSSDQIIMDVKFAHRFDAPGCLDIRSLQVNITETHLRLSAHCLISGEKVKYVLDFDLFAPADTEKSGYKSTSMGRVNIHIRKKTKAQWKLPMQGKKPANLQVWIEMQERAQADLDSLEETSRKSEL